MKCGAAHKPGTRRYAPDKPKSNKKTNTDGVKEYHKVNCRAAYKQKTKRDAQDKPRSNKETSKDVVKFRQRQKVLQIELRKDTQARQDARDTPSNNTKITIDAVSSNNGEGHKSS